MFEQVDKGRGRDLPGYTIVSVGLHALLVAAFLALASFKVKDAARKEVEVAFIGPGKGKGAPPPGEPRAPDDDLVRMIGVPPVADVVERTDLSPVAGDDPVAACGRE